MDNDDIYVISAPGGIRQQDADRIKEHCENSYPGKKFLVLGDGMHLYRVSAKDVPNAKD